MIKDVCEDCSANNECNLNCPVGEDPDCEDCSANNECNLNCPVGEDPDCGASCNYD